MKHTVIKLHYQDDEGRVMGYNGAFMDMKHLKEIFTRYNIREDNIAHVFLDGSMISKQRLKNMFHILDNTTLPRREEENMKNGKKPSRTQKEIMVAEKLNPAEWLVVKNLPSKLQVVNRSTGELKELAV